MTMHPVEAWLRRELLRAMRTKRMSAALDEYTQRRGNELRAEGIREMEEHTARQQREAELAKMVEPLDLPRLSQTSAPPEYRHWYRIREWPVALCGYVSKHATFAEGVAEGRARDLPVCPECRELDMKRLGVSS